MHMLEDHNEPDHCVVFITSDQDFGEKILELQRRNFKVVVLCHEPHASQRTEAIINAADQAHDWLPFLRRELNAQHLSISSYDATVYHFSKAPAKPATSLPSNLQASIQLQQPSACLQRVRHQLCLPQALLQGARLPSQLPSASLHRVRHQLCHPQALQQSVSLQIHLPSACLQRVRHQLCLLQALQQSV